MFEIEKYLTTNQVMEMFNVSRNTLYNWRVEENMPYYGKGTGIRYKEDEVIKWYNDRKGQN